MKKRKQAFLSLAAALLLAVFAVCPVFAVQDGPDIFAESYCVMDRMTGEIIFQKNMDDRYYPASITKIMTALVVLENCDDLEAELTFSDEAVNSLSDNSSTLTPKAGVGEKMTVKDALYGMLLCSANECANALAEYTAGSVEAFVELMNARAQEIGAVNTHYVNPHGLHDDEHYTTPHDMALIFQEALKNEKFLEIDSTCVYQIPETNLNAARDCGMTHRLLNGSIECEGAYAGKTGNTAEAGRTLATAAKRHGYDLIFIIMKSDQDHFYTDTQILMEYAFGKATGSYPDLVYQEKDDLVYASGSLRIRQFPSIYATQMGSAEAGEELHRIGTYGGWSQVEAAGGAYYVSTDYLVNGDGSAVAAPYTTLSPSEANYPEPETTQEYTTESAPLVTKAADSSGQNVPGTQEQKPSASAGTRAQSSHTYEINEEVLLIVIVAIIMVIAVIAGVLVAVLIMRRA